MVRAVQVRVPQAVGWGAGLRAGLGAGIVAGAATAVTSLVGGRAPLPVPTAWSAFVAGIAGGPCLRLVDADGKPSCSRALDRHACPRHHRHPARRAASFADGSCQPVGDSDRRPHGADQAGPGNHRARTLRRAPFSCAVPPDGCRDALCDRCGGLDPGPALGQPEGLADARTIRGTGGGSVAEMRHECNSAQNEST
jgi:hypothetical protein